ncbi:hypothetical protein F66182_3282 [Fusarium sp. NRRL 66182]|nr:hypothetical protein F66182_3282 [Fusarium sp. NRRL 66182]
MPLPVIPPAGTDPRYAQYQFFFLALLSMRKLLNCIPLHLYSRDRSDDNVESASLNTDRHAAFLSVSLSVIYEPDRQLEEWVTCLPQGLGFASYSEAQFSKITPREQHRPTDKRLRGHPIARYFAAKPIIHRPNIYKALHCDPAAALGEDDTRGARTALGSALMSYICKTVALLLSLIPRLDDGGNLILPGHRDRTAGLIYHDIVGVHFSDSADELMSRRWRSPRSQLHDDNEQVGRGNLAMIGTSYDKLLSSWRKQF